MSDDSRALTRDARPRDDDGGVLYPIGVAILVFVLILGFAWLPRVFRAHEPESVGKPAPEFSLPVLAQGAAIKAPDAANLASKDFAGKAVVLDFWASWCGPCKAEMPIIDSVARRYASKDVMVVGVNTSDDEDNARAFLAGRALAFPAVSDGQNEVANKFGVVNLPTLVVISKSGKVSAMRVGVTDASELEHLIDRALAQ